jgi:hypothetical protein
VCGILLGKKDLSWVTLVTANVFQTVGLGLLSTIPLRTKVATVAYGFQVIPGTDVGFNTRVEVQPREQGICFLKSTHLFYHTSKC